MLSIIVPLYNVEKYVEKCLTSICNQNYKDCEVILVDDGSTDNTASICKSYCEKDQRLRYYYKENEGVSIARNKGLAMATGDIIGFVDSDDWIHDDMYTKMIDYMQDTQADAVICDALSVWDDGRTQIDSFSLLDTSCVIDKYEMSTDVLREFTGAVWRCIYKREVVIGKAFFPEGQKLSEDRIFNVYALGNCSKIAYLKDALYYRYMRPGSAVNQYYANKFGIALRAYQEIEKAIRIKWDNSYIPIYQVQFVWTCLDAINSICSMQSKNSLGKMYHEIKMICNNEEVNKAIVNGQLDGYRINCIRKRKYIQVLLYTLLANVKNRR